MKGQYLSSSSLIKPSFFEISQLPASSPLNLFFQIFESRSLYLTPAGFFLGKIQLTDYLLSNQISGPQNLQKGENLNKCIFARGVCAKVKTACTSHPKVPNKFGFLKSQINLPHFSALSDVRSDFKLGRGGCQSHKIGIF